MILNATCYSDLTCGNKTVKSYCRGDLLCTNMTNYLCLNPGSVAARCSFNMTNICVPCPNGCLNNSCAVAKAGVGAPVFSPSNSSSCRGCFYDDTSNPSLQGKCLPDKVRVIYKSKSTFCDLDGKFKVQKLDDEKCFNNFECVSNQCSSGVCVGIVDEIREQAGLLKRIWCFLKSIFGNEDFESCIGL